MFNKYINSYPEEFLVITGFDKMRCIEFLWSGHLSREMKSARFQYVDNLKYNLDCFVVIVELTFKIFRVTSDQDNKGSVCSSKQMSENYPELDGHSFFFWNMFHISKIISRHF